ncbi:uncharacterized protein EI97DRAFT_464281 [Westerdykella ornata]|uniref:Uncharacterized protein n=1 Tax=Westerdykella ornata TaxID=318751 RepID=A0A6A6JV82_WESOR|nr:uncharacterized protein EI97DRAFT_464281 [Westerdykella ornata]KAF2280297.1 hypothetical protein EI97DRAFT_464281 [Westerdykella ornata]
MAPPTVLRLDVRAPADVTLARILLCVQFDIKSDKSLYQQYALCKVRSKIEAEKFCKRTDGNAGVGPVGNLSVQLNCSVIHGHMARRGAVLYTVPWNQLVVLLDALKRFVFPSTPVFGLWALSTWHCVQASRERHANHLEELGNTMESESASILAAEDSMAKCRSRHYLNFPVHRTPIVGVKETKANAIGKFSKRRETLLPSFARTSKTGLRHLFAAD